MLNQNKIPILLDAICDNFMKAINHGPWVPQFDQQTNKVVKTFCNDFVAAVAKAVGYNGFWPAGTSEPMMANRIYDLVSTSPVDWQKEANAEMAQVHAASGALVVAAWKNPAPEGHGHVCIVRPGVSQPSGNFGHNAPRCANVGETCFLDKNIAYAFHSEPEYFVWISSLPTDAQP